MTRGRQTRRRAARWAFGLFVIAWATASHWPNLRAPPVGISNADKVVHFGAFVTWTVLLGLTGWVGTGAGGRRRVIVVALLYAILDEATQAFPILGRHADFSDLLADVAGAAVGLAILTLIGPTRAQRDS